MLRPIDHNVPIDRSVQQLQCETCQEHGARLETKITYTCQHGGNDHLMGITIGVDDLRPRQTLYYMSSCLCVDEYVTLPVQGQIDKEALRYLTTIQRNSTPYTCTHWTYLIIGIVLGVSLPTLPTQKDVPPGQARGMSTFLSYCPSYQAKPNVIHYRTGHTTESATSEHHS